MSHFWALLRSCAGVLALFASFCTLEASSVEPPSWYAKEELFGVASHEVVGFGSADSLLGAQAQAQEMIAQKLMVRVESSFESVSSEAQSKSQAKLRVTSKLDLQNIKTLKQEQAGGVYFVALSFANLDFVSRVKERLGVFACVNAAQNRYLAKTPLFERLNAALGCKLDFRLHRQNGAWYLKREKELFLLGNAELDGLFVSMPSEQFGFSTPKRVLKDGERFHFSFDAPNDGYITLLDVYESGVVTLLQPSMRYKKGMQIPPRESKDDFEAGVLEAGRAMNDLYVAFFTPKPLDMSRFVYAGEEFAKDEKSYKLDELLELMQKHESATLLLRTEPR